MMNSIRCRCGKIVCQVMNLPAMPKVEDGPPAATSPAAVILCRHCKTYVVLQVPAVTAVQFTHSAESLEPRPGPVTQV